jgi:hypothetical protein
MRQSGDQTRHGSPVMAGRASPVWPRNADAGPRRPDLAALTVRWGVAGGTGQPTTAVERAATTWGSSGSAAAR